MSLEIDVLRALFVLSRRARKTTLRLLSARVGAEHAVLRTTLVTLAQAGLIQASPLGPRLSMAGLAVAVAASAPPRAKRLRGAPRIAHARRRAA